MQALAVFVVTRRRDDTCARVVRPLNRVVADAAGTTGNQERLSCHRSIGEHTTMRRHDGDPQTGPYLVSHTLRQQWRALVTHR